MNATHPPQKKTPSTVALCLLVTKCIRADLSIPAKLRKHLQLRFQWNRLKLKSVDIYNGKENSFQLVKNLG